MSYNCLQKFHQLHNLSVVRDKDRGDFVIPRTRTRTADSAFTLAVPSAWNALLSELSDNYFKNHLL